MKPITKTTEDVVDELLKKRTEELNTKLDEISSKMIPKRREKDEKVEEIIRMMKGKVPERIVRKEPDEVKKVEEIKKEPEKIKEPEHYDVQCPTCEKGHIHRLESSGLTMKCTDGSCGEEYFVIPKGADHTCTKCGYPIKKPVDNKLLDACPFCKNDKAVPFSNGKPVIKFDFSKIKW